MSGEIYALRHKTALLPCSHFHDLAGKKVVLTSADGEDFEVSGEAAAISGRIRKLAAAGQVGDGIKMAMPKSVLQKLVDFMTYHEEVPCPELRVEVTGDGTLTDYGVPKWDAAFLNVDKDMIFELIIAAITEEIPSLSYLATAMATKLVKDKSSAELAKKYGLTKDLTEDDENDLTQGVTEKRKAKFGLDDADYLPGLAVILQGLMACAEKNGLLEATSESGLSLKSMKTATWRAAVMENWQILANAPAEVLEDRELMLAAVKASGGKALQYATDEARSDKKIILAAVAQNGESLKEASVGLRSDPDFVAQAIAIDPTALAAASDAIRSDRDFLITAARNGNGLALSGADPFLRKDELLVSQCVELDPASFKGASEDLQNDQVFAVKLAERNGLILQYMPPKLQADRQVVAAAVGNCRQAIAFAHSARRIELDAEAPKASKSFSAEPAPQPLTQYIQGITLSQYRSEAPRSLKDPLTWVHKAAKSVNFSAPTTMQANMGQSNYCSSNSYLNNIPFYERPEIDGITVMWGAITGIGMRLKAFGSMDFLNNSGIQLSVDETAWACYCTFVHMDPPEWYTFNCIGGPDEQRAFLTPTAGMGTGGGWRPSETADTTPKLTEKPQHIKPAAAAPNAKKITKDRPKEAAKKEEAPLGGWLGITGSTAHRAGEPHVGAVVEIVGLKQKSGSRGMLVKLCSDGKWKVNLDDGKGLALLRPANLKVIDVDAEEAERAAAAAAAVALAKAAKEEAEAKQRERDREEEEARQREAQRAAEEAAAAEREAMQAQAEAKHRSVFREKQRLIRESRPRPRD